MNRTANVVRIGLSAAIVSVAEETPRVLAVGHANDPDGLPFGPFDPLKHRTLESGLRSWVNEQTYLDLDYAEQLYTFGDRGRHMVTAGEGPRVVSVGYLALVRAIGELKAPDAHWRDWYGYFPWEDWRKTRPPIIDSVILPALAEFAKAGGDAATVKARRARTGLCFGSDGIGWDEERVLERYELLYEAGLVEEAKRDGRAKVNLPKTPLGQSMVFDHRRILATAIARLRGKMKYRPVVFELMPPAFTLLELQRTVEAISGIRLHKQNFRRLVEGQGLVERTGKMSTSGRGRPAELFRFRREVLSERPSPGLRFGTRR
jgi:hypothetical protein